jgi:hypothetical protein
LTTEANKSSENSSIIEKENNPFSNLRSQLQSLRSSQTNIFNNSGIPEEKDVKPRNDLNNLKFLNNSNNEIPVSAKPKDFNKSSFFQPNNNSNIAKDLDSQESKNSHLFSQIFKNPVTDSQFLQTKTQPPAHILEPEGELSFGFGNLIQTKENINSISKPENESKFPYPLGKKSKFLIKESNEREELITVPQVSKQKNTEIIKDKITEEKNLEKMNPVQSTPKIKPQQWIKKTNQHSSILESVSWKRALEHLRIDYEKFQSSIQNSDYNKLPEPLKACYVAKLTDGNLRNTKVPHLLVTLKSFEMHKDTVTVKLMVFLFSN